MLIFQNFQETATTKKQLISYKMFSHLGNFEMEFELIITSSDTRRLGRQGKSLIRTK